MINPWLQQDSLPFQKKTALTAVAVMVEGCAEHIRNKYEIYIYYNNMKINCLNTPS